MDEQLTSMVCDRHSSARAFTLWESTANPGRVLCLCSHCDTQYDPALRAGSFNRIFINLGPGVLSG